MNPISFGEPELMFLNMVNSKSFINNMLGFSVVPAFTALVTIFVIPVVSNVFPVDEYGKINIFYSMGTLLMTGATLGLDNSLIRYYFEPPKGLTNKGIHATALATGAVVIAAGALLFFLFARDAVSTSLFGESGPYAVPLLAAYTLALVVFRLLNIDARMRGNVRLYNVQSIAQCLVTRISFVFVAIWSTYFLYSVVAMTVGMLFIAAFCLILQRDSLSFEGCDLTARSYRALLAFGVPMMLTTFVLNLNTSVGKFILGGYGFYDAAGVLAIATTLANVFSIIPTAFNTYWSPFMYKNYRDEQPFIMHVHDYVMLGSLLIAVAIVLLQDVLFCIVGGEYASCQAYFMLIMLNPIQSLVCETTAYGIVLEEHPAWNTGISAVGVAVCAGTTVALAPGLGVLGAAYGVAASSLVIGIARSVVGQKYYRSVASPARTATASALVCALCLLNGVMAESWALRLALCGACVAASCLIYRREFGSALGYLKGAVSRLRRRN